MGIKVQDTPNRLAVDARVSQDIREAMAKDPQQGLKEAARQFETMFLQMVMKSMRDATPQDGLMDSDQTRFYTSMLDQQLAQNLASGKGLGFARLIEEQLGQYLRNSGEIPTRGLGNLPGMTPSTSFGRGDSQVGLPAGRASPMGSPTAEVGVPATAASDGAAPTTAREFVNRVWPHAVEASRSTGIPPQFLVAHSALESGWGRSEPRRADGGNSFNLFGIKAGKNWNGPTLDAVTTEYVDGQAQRVTEKFRAYGSYAEAFQDYAALLRNSPRFGAVIGSQDGTEFARRLQQAGYATDPAYAEKLARIIAGPTLRQALIG
ncbi:MAG TPA: flagellar assembly peptidoglycan hydrolase FlgJ [Rhodocyclaceae bacterium]|nr:flagellar assembly peptidoglycan hydrolase FlgJ [Rhodocyclaceae bacterium]